MPKSKKHCEWRYFLQYTCQDVTNVPECKEDGVVSVRYSNSDGSSREKVMLCGEHKAEAFKRGL